MTTLKEQHQTVLDEVNRLTSIIKAEDRHATPKEKHRLEGLAIELRELDERLEKATAFRQLLDNVARIEGEEPLDGHGVLPLGRGSKALADSIQHRGTYLHGSKAFVTPGAVTVSVPLLPEIIEEGTPVPSLLDVIPATTRGPIYKYLRQTVRTLNAGPPDSGTGVKPTTVVTLDDVDATLKVIATMSEPIDKYLLADNSSLQRFLTTQLRYAIRVELERQIVSGDGTNGEIKGILEVAGTKSQPFSTDYFATTRKAITQLEADGYESSVFAMSPDDWEQFELSTDLEGRYYLPGQGAPIDRAARRIWGIPVTVTNALDPGTALLWDRTALGLSHDGNLDVEWANTHSTDFEKNLLRFRVEGRYNLDVFQPEAVVEITLGAGS